MKKALIIHQEIPTNAPPDERDVLEQAAAILESLAEMEYRSELEPVSLNLEKLQNKIIATKPEVVFNLVETLGGHGRLIHLVAALLESMQVPFTGSGQTGLYKTTGKIIAKEEMIRKGIPTPKFFKQDQHERIPKGQKYILKPVWEDASVGITDEMIVTSVRASSALHSAFDTGINEWFFEEYIEGREFNVTMLETTNGWKVFTPAEILFDSFPAGKPRILGYQSKWEGNSFEYSNTPRTFEVNYKDRLLIHELQEISMQCVQVFQLGGYARVDFRVDQSNRPFVLEVNANPCLSPDAGFFAACRNEGMDYTGMISHILKTAYRS